jgi:uncharacterized protein (UPF0335 family)
LSQGKKCCNRLFSCAAQLFHVPCDESGFPLWVAVDERDAALTADAPLWSVILRFGAAQRPGPPNLDLTGLDFTSRNSSGLSAQFIQEYPMATSAAALKEEPATKFAKDQLKAIIERIERLEEEKKTISDDIRDVYAEAKGNGYDVKALRTIVRMRKQDANERAEQETILETYMQALGML